MKREEKQKSVEEMQQIASKAKVLVLADYRGLNVGEMVNLRREIRKAGGGLKVVKNTLFQRALQGTRFENLNPHLEGPVAAVFHRDDPAPALKVVGGWVRSQPKFRFRVGGLVLREGQPARLIDQAQLVAAANLPSRPVLLGGLIGQLGSPLIRFNQVLKAGIWKLFGTLEAVKRQKESTGGG